MKSDKNANANNQHSIWDLHMKSAPFSSVCLLVFVFLFIISVFVFDLFNSKIHKNLNRIELELALFNRNKIEFGLFERSFVSRTVIQTDWPRLWFYNTTAIPIQTILFIRHAHKTCGIFSFKILLNLLDYRRFDTNIAYDSHMRSSHLIVSLNLFLCPREII